MSGLFEEWLVRVVPPRTGNVRAVVAAANGASQNVELDNDIFQFTSGGATQNYGVALMRVQADGADAYVLFGPTNAVTANSASTSNNATMPYKVPSGQEREFEVNPSVDKWMAYQGAGATVRYYVTTYPKSSTGFGS